MKPTIALTSVALLASHAFGGAAAYTITAIQPPNNKGDSYALSLNNAGEICGTFGGNATPFTFEDGAYHLLPSAQSGGGSLSSLNNEGDGIGFDAQTPSPVYFNGKAFTPLAAPAGLKESSCFAENLNNTGEVVGLSGGDAFVGGVNQPFATPILWAHHKASVLPTLGGKGVSGAGAVNDSGEIVGTSVNTHGVGEAVMWANGKIKALGTLGGWTATGVDVNASGEVAGTAFTASGAFHGFEWVDGHMTDLGPVSAIKAINDAGEIVGNGKTSPMMWVNGNATDLNTLLPANAGWDLLSANDINDDGQIVGIGRYKGTEEAYLLTPPSTSINDAAIFSVLAPEPATLGVLSSILALVSRRSRRIETCLVSSQR